MSSQSKLGYSLVKRIKDEAFDAEQLDNYDLLISLGNREVQLAVIGVSSRVLLIEDYQLNGIKSINQRISVIVQLFDQHSFLKAGFWKSVKISSKTFKFTLVPSAVFTETAKADYLSVNTTINPSFEEVKFIKHSDGELINVFAVDKKLTNWISKHYAKRPFLITHQGTAFIEGLQSLNKDSTLKGVYILLDKGILHAVCLHERRLLYYNQFSVANPEEMAKYLLLVMRELNLKPKEVQVFLWGGLRKNSKHLDTLKKYIRNIHFGERPDFLRFNFAFDEIPDQQYFDLFSIQLCPI